VATELVKSLAQPGGNVTGVSLMIPELAAKRLQLLKEAVPGISRVMVLTYLVDPIAPLQVKAMTEPHRWALHCRSTTSTAATTFRPRSRLPSGRALRGSS